MDMPDKKPAGRLGVAIFTGGGADEADDYGSKSPREMACKALWKSIKDDDHEGFHDALAEYLDARDREKSEKSTDASEADETEM